MLGTRFFFLTSATESLTAPVSLSYPSKDDDTAFTRVDELGVVLEIRFVEPFDPGIFLQV